MSDSWGGTPIVWPPDGVTDDTIVIDRLDESDAERIAEACGDADIQRFVSVPVPYTLDDAKQFISEAHQAADEGRRVELAVRRASDRRLVGCAGIHLEGHPHRVAEIGYWTAPDVRGQGYARRAAALLARYAIEALGAQRVELLTATDNIASRGVATAAGGHFEGIKRNGLMAVRSEDRIDAAVFSIVPDDLG